MKSNNSKLIVIFVVFGFILSSFTQCPKKFKNKEYWAVVYQRAGKIVNTLNLQDSIKIKTVKEVIASQYYELNAIHDSTDAQVQRLKQSNFKQSEIESRIQKLNVGSERQLAHLHKHFLRKLGKELSVDRIEDVKNGMTYNILGFTLGGYEQMLPDLTKEQHQYILQALTEAREKAMDAGSAKAKHAWFGKYKGRINNYLSAQGYDLNAAGKAWKERIEAQKNENK